MQDLKVSTRMLLMMGILSALLVVIGGLGLFGLGNANDALKAVYEDRTVPAAQLGEIRALQLHNRLAIALAVESKQPEVIVERTAQVEANIAAVGKLWAAYKASKSSAEEDRLADSFAVGRATMMQEGLLPAISALRRNDIQAAAGLMALKIRPLSIPVEKDIDALTQLQVDEARKDYVVGVTRATMIRNVSLAVIVGGLLFAGLLGFAMVRSIGRLLGAEPGEAAALARSVAAGDLSSPIALRSGDTTSLMAQLKSMQDSLSLVVSDVRRNSESVASASAQIAQGNNDLAARTEQQASALQQTAASMEQLSATVKQNAESARSGNQSANRAREVAAEGGEVVSRVVATMKDINDSSRKIADITAVIDGIAFQTNILALNAAVEAARAGEQGRGFAVVATEVRSLAKRSADAAKEIKGLIGASVERVAQGTALVDQAGTTMTEVVASITRVTDIMGQISAASTEQALGVAQVGEAVMQMDQATQQNAALVEESAAAAESLNAQAQHLVEAVAVFKIDQGNASRAVAPIPKVKRAIVPARLATVALITSGRVEQESNARTIRRA